MVIQSFVAQYNHDSDSEIDLAGNSVEYMVVYRKLFHMVKHANVPVAEYCELMQKNIL